jgi:hypothetical protein
VVAVNVVEPHPLVVVDRGLDVVDAKVNVGNASANVSLLFNGTFNANVNVSTDGAARTGLCMVSELTMTAGVNVVTAVDFVIWVVAETTSAASANITPTCRNEESKVWSTALVVIPVATVTSHLVLASIIVVAAVSVSVAVAVAELVPATLNVVVPHPFFVTDGSVPNVNVGSTSATLSFTFSGDVSSNEYEIDDSAKLSGFAMVSLFARCITLLTTVDTLTPSATMSVAEARVTATWRAPALEACASEFVVTPVANDTVHWLYAVSSAEPACNARAAVPVPELLPVVVKEVVPHPVVVEESDVGKANVGRLSVTVSLVASGTFNAKVNAMLDGAALTLL